MRQPTQTEMLDDDIARIKRILSYLSVPDFHRAARTLNFLEAMRFEIEMGVPAGYW